MSKRNVKYVNKISLAFSVILIVILSQFINTIKSPLIVQEVNNDNCYGVHLGDKVTYVNNIEVKNINDFDNALRNVIKGEKVELVVNDMPAKCYAINDHDIGIKIGKSITFPLFGSDIKRVVYTVYSDEDEIKTIEKRLYIAGLDDFQIKKISDNKYEIRIPTFFKTVFENKILKPYKTEFFLVKYINKNETTNITNSNIVNVNSTTNKIEVKIFDYSDIKDSTVKKNCLSQAAESCHISISLQLENSSFEKFKKVVKEFGFRIVLLRKFVDGELEIRVDNKTVITSYLPYKIIELEHPSIILTLPVNESYANKAEYVLKYALETEPLEKTKIIKTEERNQILLSMKDSISLIILATSLSLIIVFKKYIKDDRNKLLILSVITIMLVISKPSAIIFAFLLFVIYIKSVDENNLVKIYTSIIILTIASLLSGMFGVLSILSISLSLSTLYILMIASAKMNKLILYTLAIITGFVLTSIGMFSVSYAISIGLSAFIFRESLRNSA